MGKIFIQYEQERYCMVYPYQSLDVTETEFHLIKAFLEAGNIKLYRDGIMVEIKD
ncbi:MULTISPECIES: hypothetical protein [unclassified Lacrimispora]|uniref:hypothetical protein n=1 Tax=unclassified Lacrimispora TaxID=2719232 RepID=UPI00376F9CAA